MNASSTADAIAKAVAADAEPNPQLNVPRAATAPNGFTVTTVLHFFEGILHQLHIAGHPGESQKVWVPIGGQEKPAPLSDQAPPPPPTFPPAA